MTTIPSLDSENEIPLRHEFVCTGFIERIASWTRFLCLSFLFLQLLAIAVNLIFPFAIDPPLFFNQLIFFLLACGAFEIFAIPIEAIKDHCIIDLQKSMVVKIYNRYFYTRVVVLATFDKISSLGVSARPKPIIEKLFSQSTRRYAILMLTENRRLYRLTDYNLELPEANKLLTSLHESYLRNTNMIYGSKNIELVVDQINNTFIARASERSAASLIDAVFLPTAQAVAGTAIVAVIVAITAMTGDFVSESLFKTSLKISNQPVFQLLLAPGAPDERDDTLEPPEGPPPAEPVFHQDTAVALRPDLFPLNQVAATPDSEVSVATAPVTQPEDTRIAAATENIQLPPSSQSADLVNSVIEPVTSASIELPPDSPPQITTAAHDNEPAGNSNTEPDKIATAKVAADKTIEASPTQTTHEQRDQEPAKLTEAAISEPPRSHSHKYELEPLPSRIPSLDENSILSPTTATDAAVSVAVRAHIPSNAVILSPETGLSAETVAREVNVPAKQPLLTGKSVSEKSALVSDYIGQSIESALVSLGKPLASIKTSEGQQLIFSGITLQTDADCKKIMQVNLTGRYSKLLGQIATREGLTVGSPIREARVRLGVPQERPGSPGLHFPAHGISIYPLPGDPGMIGSIKLYKSE